MKNLRLAAVVAVCFLFFSGCSRETRNSEVHAATTTGAPVPPGGIAIDHPELFALATAQERSLRDDLTVNGVVAPDVSLTVPVNSMSAGRVIDIRARLGDDVKQGQLLLRVQSPDLSGAIADHEKAVADEALSHRALERARTLYEHGALAQKDLETAQDAEQKAMVDVRTTAERIRILGAPEDTTSPVIDITAPVSGTIVEQNIASSGGVKSLDNSPNLFTIADLSRVWVLCDVYENNVAQVHLGDAAEVRLVAYPNRVLRGRVSNIGSILDPNTRTAKVRLELENPGGIMRPGMFATARFISSQAAPRVVLPASAILRLHDKDWVFRPLGGKQFARVEIRAGASLPDGTQEVFGVKPGERVVGAALQFASSVENQ